MCADGQKIAKKLSAQIQKETSKIKSLLPEYNACQLIVGGEFSTSMTLKEALEPSNLSKLTDSEPSVCSQSNTLKRELINSLIMVRRASEELVMLKSEMNNTILHYKNTRATLVRVIGNRETECATALDRGAVSLLKNMCNSVERELNVLNELFEPVLNVTHKAQLDMTLYESDSSEECMDSEYEDSD